MPSKAEAKQQAKRKSAIVRAQALTQDSISQDLMLGARRSLSDQVDRLRSDHFLDFTNEEMFVVTGGAGNLTLNEWLTKWKSDGGVRLSGARVAQLRAIYRKKGSMQGLKPKVKQPVNSKLAECVAASMVSNSFQRDRDSLYAYLSSRTEPLNETEFLVILRSLAGLNCKSKPSDADHAIKVLSTMWSSKLLQAHTEHLIQHSQLVEDAIITGYSIDVNQGDVLPTQFIAQHRFLVDLLNVDVDKVCQVLKEGVEVDPSFVMLITNQSTFCKMLFQHDFPHLRVSQCMNKLQEVVDGLLGMAELPSELLKAKQEQMLEVADSCIEDLKQFPKVPIRVQLQVLGRTIELPAKSVTHLQSLMWAAFVRNRNYGKNVEDGGIALPLPIVWSDVYPVSSKKPLPKPHADKIHEGVEWVNSRITDHCLKSSSAILACLAKCDKHVKRISPDSAIELALLKQLADADGLRCYHSQLKACLGSASESKSLVDVLNAWKALQLTPFYDWLPADKRGVADADFQIVQQVQMGQVTHESFAALSGNKKTFAELCLWSIKFEAVDPKSKIAKTLTGRMALDALLDSVVAQKGKKDDGNLNTLAQFGYLVNGNVNMTKFATLKKELSSASIVPHVTPSKKRKATTGSASSSKSMKKEAEVLISEKDALLADMENWFA